MSECGYVGYVCMSCMGNEIVPSFVIMGKVPGRGVNLTSTYGIICMEWVLCMLVGIEYRDFGWLGCHAEKNSGRQQLAGAPD